MSKFDQSPLYRIDSRRFEAPSDIVDTTLASSQIGNSARVALEEGRASLESLGAEVQLHFDLNELRLNDVDGVLRREPTKLEAEGLERAWQFLKERATSMGVDTLPEPVSVIFDDTPGNKAIPSDGSLESGTRHIRLLGLEGFLESGRRQEEWEALAVHEISHALAWMKVVTYRTSSGVEAQLGAQGWDRYGATSKLKPIILGRAFEEYAAEGHYFAYLKSLGMREGEVSHPGRIKLAVADSTRAALYRIVEKVGRPESFSALNQARGKASWTAMMLHLGIRGVPLEIPLRSYEIAGSAPKTKAYSALIATFDKLAEEIYPGIEPDKARQKFRDAVGEAQLTGDHRPVLHQMKEAFGNKAVRWLLNLSAPTPENSILEYYLTLFTLAGSLEEGERRQTRAELIALSPRRYSSEKLARLRLWGMLRATHATIEIEKRQGVVSNSSEEPFDAERAKRHQPLRDAELAELPGIIEAANRPPRYFKRHAALFQRIISDALKSDPTVGEDLKMLLA